MNSAGPDDGILAAMPVVSIFFGIVIRMYFWEHEPKHFHAEHQALEGKFDFDGNQIVGNITSRNAEASGALIVGDVGQGAREEINYEPAGAVRRANTCPILRDRPIRGVPFTAHPR